MARQHQPVVLKPAQKIGGPYIAPGVVDHGYPSNAESLGDFQTRLMIVVFIHSYSWLVVVNHIYDLARKTSHVVAMSQSFNLGT